MLAHLLLIIIVPGTWTVLEALPPLPTGPHALHIFLSLAFQNFTMVDILAWSVLDDIVLAALRKYTWEIIYLQPWVYPSLSVAEWEYLQDLFKIYVHNFILLLNRDAEKYHEPYPFVYQSMTGCDLYPNGSYTKFYRLGYNGQDLITFDVDKGLWEKQSRENVATRIEMDFNSFTGFSATLQELLNFTCVDHMKKFILVGKEDLQRQVKPMAVVFARVPGPVNLLLVCHVTGFYPRPVRVDWLRDGQEVPPGPELNSTLTLPNADLTYQLHSFLAVAPHDGHSYACRVQHSSLGGRSLLVPWVPERPKTQHIMWIFIVIILITVVAIAGARWWRRRRN
uniref:Ig-like domain-containing protein n=1 Tax=Apteryx owenii TaxID=8824 RepID=A0A8B9P721_APTOW